METTVNGGDAQAGRDAPAGRPFFKTGGTMSGDAESYVARRADDELYAGLMAGEFCYVLTSRQMGKSSLMVRTAARLRAAGLAVAMLDLTAFGHNLTAEQWYHGMSDQLGRQIGLEDEVGDYWDAHARGSPLQRWMGVLEDVAAPRSPRGLVIFVDEIDFTRSLPFGTDELFAAVRECYNRRTTDATFGRVVFCLLGVATPSDLIRDTRTTPFNVGLRVELTDFTPAEAAPLARGLGREPRPAGRLLRRVLHWTGGHPYLTQRLCQAVAETPSVAGDADVDRLCHDLFLSARARGSDDNLLFVRERLLRSEVDLAALLELYDRVRGGRRVAYEETNALSGVLRLSGVTRVSDGRLTPRNRVYGRVFDRRWVRENLPDQERRRQRAAYVRGLARAGALALIVVAAVGALAGYALHQARVAGDERRSAEGERRSAQEAAGREARAKEALQAQQDDLKRARDAARMQAEAAEAARASEAKARQEVEARQAETLKARIAADEQARAAREAAVREAQAKGTLQVQYGELVKAWDDAKAARTDAQRTSADLAFDRAERTWSREGQDAALLWLARALSLCPPGDAELQRVIRQGVAYAHGQTHVLRAVIPHPAAVWAGDVSPDGRSIATGAEDGALRFFDAGTLAPGRSIAHPAKVTLVRFSPDGKTVLTVCDDKQVRTWDVATGRAGPAWGFDAAVRCARFTPAGDRAVVGTEDGVVHVVRPGGGGDGVALKFGTGGELLSLAVSPDGRRIMTGGQFGAVQTWDAASGEKSTEPMPAWANDIGDFFSLEFSGDGTRLAGGRAFSSATLDVRRGRWAGSQRHESWVTDLRFLAGDSLLLTASRDTAVRLFEADTGMPVGARMRHLQWVRAVGAGAGGGPILAVDGGRAAYLWERTQPAATTVVSTSAPVQSMALSADGRVLITGHGDRFGATADQARVWDVGTGAEIGLARADQGPILKVALSPDGRTAAAVGGRKVRVWPVGGPPADVREFDLAEGTTARAVAFSPDGKRVAVGTGVSGPKFTGTVRVLDAVTGEPAGAGLTLPSFAHTVRFLDDRRVAVAMEGHAAAVWDVTTGKLASPMLLHRNAAYGVCPSPDGGRLLTTDFSGWCQFWDTQTWRQTGPAFRHTATAALVGEFSPDGRTIASGGYGATVHLWDAGTGHAVAGLDHRMVARCIAFTPDGKRLLTGCEDGRVRAWTIPAPAEGDPDRIALESELRTNMELDRYGAVRILSADEWADRRRRLDALGNPPAGAAATTRPAK